MTIDEAIRLIHLLIGRLGRYLEQDDLQAISLALEALKLVKDKRGYPEYIIPMLLPGETKE